MSAKSAAGRKAAKSVVKHSVHGTVSKAKRNPARASRLIGLGTVLGAVAGFLAGRRTAPAPSPTPIPVKDAEAATRDSAPLPSP